MEQQFTQSEQQFINAASFAFFASAYADLMDGQDNPMQGEIMDQLPDTIDPSAIEAAEALLRRFKAMNKDKYLSFWGIIEYIQTNATGDRESTIDNIGHYVAMQAMGHGVGLYEAFGRAIHEAVSVPGICYSHSDFVNRY
jgi:hypothetical protein